MSTSTTTKTKAISGTKLAIATLVAFATGGIAFVGVPAGMSAINKANDCVDSDNKLSASDPFLQDQLFIKSSAKLKRVTQTDYCYEIPGGKTYLMEYVCKKNNLTTWQKNCAELNLGKKENDFRCIDGACVNMATKTGEMHFSVKPLIGKLYNGTDLTLGTIKLFATNEEIILNTIKFTFEAYSGSVKLSNLYIENESGFKISEIKNPTQNTDQTQVVFNLENFSLPDILSSANVEQTLVLKGTVNGISTLGKGYNLLTWLTPSKDIVGTGIKSGKKISPDVGKFTQVSNLSQ